MCQHEYSSERSADVEELRSRKATKRDLLESGGGAGDIQSAEHQRDHDKGKQTLHCPSPSVSSTFLEESGGVSVKPIRKSVRRGG